MAFGDVKGTLTVTGASITNPFVATGSVAVATGDLVFCVLTEQRSLSVTAVTDNLGGAYTATNAGSTSGAGSNAVSGRAFYKVITTPGTLTSVSATVTAATQNASFGAVVFAGPFGRPPIDVNVANVTAGAIASPFSYPATGVLSFPNELVVSWLASRGGATFTAVAPSILALSLDDGLAVHTNVEIVSRVVTTTASVTQQTTETGNAVAANIAGTSSFVPAIPGTWIPQWRNPVREKIGFKAHEQQVLAWAPLDPNTQITHTFESRWHYQWSEPVRIKPRLQEGLQQTLAQGPLVTPQPLVNALTAPFDSARIVRKRQVQYQSRIYTPFIEQVTIDKWLQQWSEPSVKTRARTPWFKPFAADTALIAVKGYESLWHQPWSEPAVKARPLHPSRYPAVQVFVPTVVPSIISVFRRLPEIPVKARHWLLTADQPVTPLWIPQEVPSQGKWLVPWSEPVRLPQGLQFYLQDAFIGIPPQPNFVRTMAWFGPFSEPQRHPLGLHPRKIEFFAVETTPHPNPNTIILQATEVSSDQALFAVNIGGLMPVRGIVSIEELPATTGALSADEQKAHNEAAVSTKEFP